MGSFSIFRPVSYGFTFSCCRRTTATSLTSLLTASRLLTRTAGWAFGRWVLRRGASQGPRGPDIPLFAMVVCSMQRISGPSGGWMGNITMRNSVIETRFMFGSQWWGSGEGLVVTSVPENAAQAVVGLPGIHNVTFENISGAPAAKRRGRPRERPHPCPATPPEQCAPRMAASFPRLARRRRTPPPSRDLSFAT